MNYCVCWTTSHLPRLALLPPRPSIPPNPRPSTLSMIHRCPVCLCHDNIYDPPHIRPIREDISINACIHNLHNMILFRQDILIMI